jgi:hypothetical protein
MSLNTHFPVYTFIIAPWPCYILLYLTSIPTPIADRFGFSIRSETYACSDVALQVLLFDTVLSTLLPNTYQNSTEGTRKCHISEGFILLFGDWLGIHCVSGRCFNVAMLISHSSSYQKSTAWNCSKRNEAKCVSSCNSLTALLVQVSLCCHNADRHNTGIQACFSTISLIRNGMSVMSLLSSFSSY